ncbi:MAG: beta strand repeat-containing protein [Caulobacteraceae bacterium]
MASIHWAKAASGSFGAAADWTGGRVPGSGDDALLDAAGSGFSVNVTAAATVASLQTAANALVDIQASFSATNGTGSGANAGGIRIENGATLTLQGPVSNTGSMEIFGGASATSIVIGQGGVTLDGGGDIILYFRGTQSQQIVGAASGAVLTDVDNRITGQGVLGGGRLTLVNQAKGFIEAKGGLLTVDTGTNTIVNAGLITAEGAPGDDGLPPGLGLYKSPLANSGILEADGDGSTLTFDGAVTGTGRAVITGGLLRFNSSFSQQVDFEGATGVLYLARSASYGAMIALFTTTGGESLDLGDIAYGGSTQASYAGTASSGTLTVTDGTHTAHIAFEGDYRAVTFLAASDGHGGTTITDRAGGGGTQAHWLNPVSGSFQTGANWSGGAAPGSGSDAILDAAGSTRYTVTASADQTVASLQTAATATLTASGAFTATGGTGAGVNAGQITIANDAVFTVGGAFDNTGLVAVDSTTGRTTLAISGRVTLSGGGEVWLGDSLNDRIVGTSTSAVLDNVQNVITGGGYLGFGELTLINEAGGKITSEEPSVPLVIDTGLNTIVNAGVIEAAGIGATVRSAVANSGLLLAEGGVLVLDRAVTGAGRAEVLGGKLDFASTFNQNVAFGSAGGVLELARSLSYAAMVSGFSQAGKTTLDLRDIAFGGSTTVSYAGTASSGTLTVSNGAHAAHIHLAGNYLSAAFKVAADGLGGTSVTAGAKSPDGQPGAVRAFAAAMAGHAAGALALPPVRSEARPSLGLVAHPFA